MTQVLNGMGSTEEIVFGRLRTSPLDTYGMADTGDLAVSIWCLGLIEPLTVAGPDADGTYEVLSGGRRYEAIGMIREEDGGAFQTVPCYIIGPADTDEVVKKAVIENSNIEARDTRYNRDAHSFTLTGLFHELTRSGSIRQQAVSKQAMEAMKNSQKYARSCHAICEDGSTYDSPAGGGEGGYAADSLAEARPYAEALPFERLKASPLNTHDMVDIEGLAASIRCLGLIAPLSVAGPDADGNYEILSGERRYEAVSMIKEEDGGAFPTVPCYIIGPADMDKDVKRIVVESSNLETRTCGHRGWDSRRFTLAGYLREFAGNGTKDQRGIAGHIEEAMRSIPKYKRIYDSMSVSVAPEMLEAVKKPVAAPRPDNSGTVNRKNSPAFGKGNFHFPDEIQKEIIRRIQDGEKAADVVADAMMKHEKEIIWEEPGSGQAEAGRTPGALDVPKKRKGKAAEEFWEDDEYDWLGGSIWSEGEIDLIFKELEEEMF
ncbi:MAG: ParB N-terminal domain-containing protein [Clostridiales bacterium]|nr:ParB N-terminal domain-containing protein [Clostridiales bacterium]